AKNSLGVAVVPLHGHVDANGVVVNDRLGTDRKHVGMQDRRAAVDVLNKALDAAQEGKVLFLALALVDQAHFYAVIQERQFAQALGQNIVVIFDVVENGGIGQEVHACALLVGGAFYLEGGDALAPIEHDFVLLALAPDGKPQPIGQCVHAGNAHAVQTAGYLVRVMVEFAAGVQLGHDDFGSATAELIVLVNVSRNTTPVIRHRDAVVGMNGDDDIVTVAGQRLVNGVVNDLEDHVVQARAVGGVANVHARSLAHGLEALEHFDG